MLPIPQEGGGASIELKNIKEILLYRTITQKKVSRWPYHTSFYSRTVVYFYYLDYLAG